LIDSKFFPPVNEETEETKKEEEEDNAETKSEGLTLPILPDTPIKESAEDGQRNVKKRKINHEAGAFTETKNESGMEKELTVQLDGHQETKHQAVEHGTEEADKASNVESKYPVAEKISVQEEDNLTKKLLGSESPLPDSRIQQP